MICVSLQVLGVVVPLALLAIVSVFGTYAYESALGDTTTVVKERARLSNAFAAKLAAQRVAGEITASVNGTSG